MPFFFRTIQNDCDLPPPTLGLLFKTSTNSRVRSNKDQFVFWWTRPLIRATATAATTQNWYKRSLPISPTATTHDYPGDSTAVRAALATQEQSKTGSHRSRTVMDGQDLPHYPLFYIDRCVFSRHGPSGRSSGWSTTRILFCLQWW